MRLVILSRTNSEQAREVSSFTRELERRYASIKPEMVEFDTKEGSNLATTYDVMTQPALIVLRNDGQLIQVWQGLPLPLIDEVASYALEQGA